MFDICENNKNIFFIYIKKEAIKEHYEIKQSDFYYFNSVTIIYLPKHVLRILLVLYLFILVRCVQKPQRSCGMIGFLFGRSWTRLLRMFLKDVFSFFLGLEVTKVILVSDSCKKKLYVSNICAVFSRILNDWQMRI